MLVRHNRPRTTKYRPSGVVGYLVASGWLLGHRRDSGGGWLWANVAGGVLFALAGIHLGLEAAAGRGDVIDGSFVVPPFIYFMFAAFAGLAALSDAWAALRQGFGSRGRMM